MSQDVNTNQKTTEHLSASTSIKPWSAESAADELMDDLFADIDRILEGGSKLPTEPIKPEYVSLNSIAIPKLKMPPKVVPTPEPQIQQDNQPHESTDVTLVKSSQTNTLKASSSRDQWSVWYWLTLILLIGVAAGAVAIVLLLHRQGKLTLPKFLNLPASLSTQNQQLSAADAQFISYMLRSLEVIERKGETQEQAKVIVPPVSIPKQLPVPTVENSSPAPKPVPTVFERVYIPYPVEPPQKPQAPAALPPAASPTVTAPSPIPSPTVTVPSPAASPTLTAPSPIPSPSVEASPQDLASVPRVVEASPAATIAATAAQHTLVGLVEISEIDNSESDKSAALFDIDGITKRIFVGEYIGTSGWTLVSVANGEAVIRRNGEVRSIYAGQKF
ncbi:MAG: hypothetical protein F6J89_08410 [Symploca sp. SIO1C4]|uniref:Type II secretion system protein GspC N-terminal domain-containing protein n=1 Tax=Symploca sp. SIO1C4 TaxID=2607765 RepID=A0A6B3NC64_9CYAN|nr:hypothetical protein [Symploca sp. SIO1C4]